MSIKEIKLAAFMVGFGFGMGFLALGTPGCSAAYRSKMGAYVTGNEATIHVNMGSSIKTYHSAGKVFSEEGSDGYYFKSRETNRLVEVSPGIVIEYQ